MRPEELAILTRAEKGQVAWGELPPAKETAGPPAGVFMGWGLLSDTGLPFDALMMSLEARRLSMDYKIGRPPILLLPDAHAEAIGTNRILVETRADRMREHAGRIAEGVGIPLEIIRASDLTDMEGYRAAHADASRLVRDAAPPEEPSPYTILGIADAVLMARMGFVKVGWSISPDIADAKGRNHEPATDRLAQQIEPSVRAVYVPHGARMDLKKPKAAPYLEMHDTSARFMLTGPDAGHFREKAFRRQGEKRAFRDAMDRLSSIVGAFERLVRPLEGADVVAKAEAIVAAMGTCE